MNSMNQFPASASIYFPSLIVLLKLLAGCCVGFLFSSLSPTASGAVFAVLLDLKILPVLDLYKGHLLFEEFSSEFMELCMTSCKTCGSSCNATMSLPQPRCYVVAFLEDRKYSTLAPFGGFAFIGAWVACSSDDFEAVSVCAATITYIPKFLD